MKKAIEDDCNKGLNEIYTEIERASEPIYLSKFKHRSDLYSDSEEEGISKIRIHSSRSIRRPEKIESSNNTSMSA